MGGVNNFREHFRGTRERAGTHGYEGEDFGLEELDQVSFLCVRSVGDLQGSEIKCFSINMRGATRGSS